MLLSNEETNDNPNKYSWNRLSVKHLHTLFLTTNRCKFGEAAISEQYYYAAYIKVHFVFTLNIRHILVQTISFQQCFLPLDYVYDQKKCF